MKLYTEEQLTAAYFMGNMDGFLNNKDYSISERFEPIELPSDEEIDRESEVLYPINKGGSMWMPSRYDIDKNNRQEGFIEGAKWIRNKIRGGNK